MSPDKITRTLVTIEWKALLARQRMERDVLTRNHEEEREMFYRLNKATLDALTPDERL